MKRLRFGLRVKLALVLVALLALPLAGILYVNEVERFLLEGQEQSLLAVSRAVATALHERPQLLASASGRDDEVDAILLGLQRASSRIWVVDGRYQVIASAGSLRRPVDVEAPWWQPVFAPFVRWLIPRPTEDFVESQPEDVLASGADVAAALQGTPASRTRTTRDGRAVVMSAAHPIWNGDQVSGAVVTEETTNSVMSVKSAALERLLLLTLAAFAGAAILLMAFATRLSLRIRRLRDEAESAIDARGRITRLAAGSGARDEIGDLSRSFSAVLQRLAEHHSYLESMAGRLSHELRTPIAVVRSSLENLKLSDQDSARYIERAEQGLARLGRILERMAEASRLEQSLSNAERSRYDLAAVVRGCVEGYRIAYPRTSFELALPAKRVEVDGAPDLAAQLLDKLVENAVDFAVAGTPVRVTLEESAGHAILTISNQGPLLPDKMRTRLFESMISMREAPGSATPHLGLGLYVARLIAEFHGGTIAASNLPSGDGVAVGVRIPVAK
jgi:two-component system, OmpR family, sensor histidine kinase ChvG